MFDDKFKKLNKYTKEEIIKAMYQTFVMSHRIDDLLQQLAINRYDHIHTKTQEAMEEWKEIAQKFNDFKAELKVKYGKERLSIPEITSEEIKKYVKFVNDEQRAYKKWDQLQREEDAYYEQM